MLGCIASCSKPEIKENTPSETEEENTPFDDTIEGKVKFSIKPELLFPGGEGSKSLIFTVDCNWKVEIPEESGWVSVSPSKGDGSSSRQSMTISVSANPESVVRTAVLVFHAGAAKEKITVTQEGSVKTINSEDIPDLDKIYIPAELRSMDLMRSDSKWSFIRSRQSEHFIVFWELGYDPYGEITPGDLKATDAFYVNIDDLLEKAEEFFRVNVDVLKFADLASGTSNLNKYKMEIFILHQTEWLATGSGYDNKIGALWVNPATCHPVGSTIAHEIGHSFQYQVYADAIANGAANDFSTGWRYGIGQGCGFWEQCAQWQSFQSYAAQAYGGDLTVFVDNCHRHFTHEHQRYASYWLMWHWASKYGVEEIGELWRASVQPEDPIETYKRIHNLSIEELNADLYDYAARCVTWDFSAEATNLDEGKLTGVTKPVRDFGKDYIGKIGWTGNYDNATGFYTVDYSRAPEATGFNHIRLNVPDDGEISVLFEGCPNTTGFNRVTNPSIAGWNVGFVCLMPDGSRVYSESTRIREKGTVSYTVPYGCSKLWMVVAATPETYLQHLWDEDDTNDEQWPYRVKFTGTDLFGNVSFDGSETPQSITLEHNLTTDASAGYLGTRLTFEDDVISIAKAFVMQPSDIVAAIPANRDNIKNGTVKIAAVEPDGSLSYNYTANGYGFWYGADGSVQQWRDAYVYVEYDKNSWTCQFGVHPEKVSVGTIKRGDTYTIRFAFVYGNYTATEIFNVTVL